MKLISIITLDWPRKLVSLLCACLIWYAVHGQISQEEIFRDIPVTLKHAKNLAILQDDLPKVNITLSGSNKWIKSLTHADIKVTGQISNEATSGRYTVLLREKNVEVPGRIQIIDIKPSSFYVYVDTVETIDEIPIRCRFIGQLDEGYGRKGFSVVPKTAQVTGPTKIVSGIKEILTETIELDQDIHEDFEIEVKTVQIPKVALTPKNVRVTVELYKMKDSKFFQNLNVTVLNTARTDFFIEKFINPNKPEIETVIGGPKATIDVLTSSSLRPFVDISDITSPGIYRLPVRVWVDANECAASMIQPMIMEVKINRQQL